jgi:hypothetical protein
MNWKWLLQKRRLRNAALLIILIGLALYGLVFALDIKTPCISQLPCINPPDQKYSIPVDIPVIFPSTQHHYIADIELSIIVSFNGTLAAWKDATLYASAWLQTPIATDNVSTLIVGFRFSYLYPVTYFGNGSAYPAQVYLSRSSSSSPYMSGQNVSLFWPTPETSAPYVQANFQTGVPLTLEYSEYAISIQPASELLAERANRVNVGLTAALVGFSLVEGVSKLSEEWGNKRSRTSENTDTCQRYSNPYYDEDG